MTYDDICAVVITKGDVSIDEIVQNLPYGEVLVRYPNETYRYNKQTTISEIVQTNEDLRVMGRYHAAELSKRPVIYFQDDDVLVPQKVHDALLAEYTPGVLISNMFDEWIEAQGYFDLATVGLGSLQDKGLWNMPFARFVAAYEGDERFQERMELDADFIYGVLAKWRRFDFDAQACINMELATDSSRLSLQPGQHERKFETISMTRRLRTVVLTMMAKNEEKNIVRALESSKSWWDSLMLLDTGSKDNTVSVAEQFCLDNNKVFHLTQAEFTDFADMRSFMIREGRTRGDYMLLQDADEEWIDVQARPELWADAYMLHYDGSVDYAQPRLIASRFPWKWSGPIHSYLDSDWGGECLAVNMPYPRIVHHGEARHGDSKARHDIEILEAEIARTDDDLARNLFLLGKAHDGLKEFDKALDYYEQRVALESPDEEDYWCRLRIGNLLAEHCNNFAGAIDALWEAHKSRPQRAEALRAMAFYCTAVADATPYPEDEITLVLRNMYRN